MRLDSHKRASNRPRYQFALILNDGPCCFSACKFCLLSTFLRFPRPDASVTLRGTAAADSMRVSTWSVGAHSMGQAFPAVRKGEKRC
jgi:hypothetical protein